MIIDNLKVIELNKLHKKDFCELYEKFNQIMYLPKNEIQSIDLMIKIYDNEYSKTFGVYYKDKLTATLTGYYPPNINLWWGFNLFTDTSNINSTLASHHISMILSLELFDRLIHYGELSERFGFYTNKNLKHQLGVEKSMDRIRKEFINGDIDKHYRMFDYHHLYEKIYPIGYQGQNGVTFRNHKILYPDNIIYNKETIVTFHTLNETERKKKLGL
jgi:hypothetical protein